MSGRARRQWPDVHSEDGFATVWVAGTMAAVLTCYSMMLWFGAAVHTRHRATAAADLAALAAAAHFRQGTDLACARASTVTERMRVHLESCLFRGRDSYIAVKADLPGPLSAIGSTGARARAGPVSGQR